MYYVNKIYKQKKYWFFTGKNSVDVTPHSKVILTFRLKNREGFVIVIIEVRADVFFRTPTIKVFLKYGMKSMIGY